MSIELRNANSRLNITKNKVVFVYSAPKVGSTSLVSSLRIFGLDKLDIIHIHDETMLKVLGQIDNITINDLIQYNQTLGKEVYVINIYRSPIERKISTFFEKIGAYHFNATDEHVNNYNISKVIKRFNSIFPHIGNGDHFIDKYNIEYPTTFDTNNKVTILTKDNIRYVSLRLKDSEEWGKILTNLFGFGIRIKRDYESNDKPIKQLFNIFKQHYKIPRNLLQDVMNNKYFKYYYSDNELTEYFNRWTLTSTDDFVSYTEDQYKLYEEITIENSHIDYIQNDHYFDEGCKCKACYIKRTEIAVKLIKGENVTERIVHSEAKNNLINKRINKINKIMKQMPRKRHAQRTIRFI